MTIPIEQIDEWQALAEAASDVYGGVLPGGGTLGYDTHMPGGIRYQFERREDAEFCSRARGIVLMLVAEVKRLRAAQCWVPVAERFPESLEDVEIWFDNWMVVYGYRSLGAKQWYSYQSGGDVSTIPDHLVTHWRPLSAPIKENK